MVWRTPGVAVQIWVRVERIGLWGTEGEEKIGSEAATSRAAVVGIATRLGEEREGIAGQMLEQVGAEALLALDPGEGVVLAAEAGSEAVAGVAETSIQTTIIKIQLDVPHGSQPL